MEEMKLEKIKGQPEGALDAGVFSETEKYRLQLRLIRNTIRNRLELLAVEAGILEKLLVDGRWPKRVAALQRRMALQTGELKELKKEEALFQKKLESYPAAYRDSAADLLDKMDSGSRGN